MHGAFVQALVDTCPSRCSSFSRRVSRLVCATTTESQSRAHVRHAVMPRAGHRHRDGVCHGEISAVGIVDWTVQQSQSLYSALYTVPPFMCEGIACAHATFTWLLPAQVESQHIPGGIAQLYLLPGRSPDEQGTLSQRQAYTGRYQV